MNGWFRLKSHRSAYWSFLFLAAVCSLSFLAPLLPLRSPREMRLATQFHSPEGSWGDRGWKNEGYEGLGPVGRGFLSLREKVFGNFQIGSWLGTDSKGRDLLSRIVWGSRVSLFVGLLAALVSLLVGVSYGGIAGLLGGKTDNFMMRVVDGLYSVPFIFVVIFLLTLMNEYRSDFAAWGIERIHLFYAVIGLIYWLTMSRVVRAQVLSLKHKEFVEAAQVIGAGKVRIFVRHLLPNLLPVVIVYLTLTIPQVMLFETFLSFLGLGIEPPDVSWGLLASDGLESLNPLRCHWWILLFPSLAMGLTLWALNRLGDGLRDALDPRLRNL